MNDSSKTPGERVSTIQEVCKARDIPYETLAPVQKIALAHQQTFLLAYGHLGNIGAAARTAGISRAAYQIWAKEDTLKFNNQFNIAVDNFADGLEDLAMSRLRDPSGNRGSDILLLAMLNAHKPEKYRQNVIVMDERPKEIVSKLAAMAAVSAGEKQAPVKAKAGDLAALEAMRGADVEDKTAHS